MDTNDDDGPTKALPLKMRILKNTCGSQSKRRIQIFGGLHGNDTQLYDTAMDIGLSVTDLEFPCGRAIILMSETSMEDDACGFDLSYSVDYTDEDGKLCAAYSMLFFNYFFMMLTILVHSLTYIPPEPFDYMVYVIPGVSIIGGLIILLCCVLYLPIIILKAQGKTIIILYDYDS